MVSCISAPIYLSQLQKHHSALLNVGQMVLNVSEQHYRKKKFIFLRRSQKSPLEILCNSLLYRLALLKPLVRRTLHMDDVTVILNSLKSQNKSKNI